jgi:cytochrome b subunit of formate dehydrogenase
MTTQSFPLAACLLLGATFASAQNQEPTLDCSMCHEQQTKEIVGTVHASVSCLVCHPKHNVFPHPSGIPKPECAKCHEEVASRERLGVHGRARAAGNLAAPDCTVCHGDVHAIKWPGTEAFRQTIPGICGMCHDQIYQQFEESVHGKAVARGIVAAPVCTTCHGEHDIQPPVSPTSPVSPAQIPETCGRCHANVRLAQRFNLPSNVLVSYQDSYHGLALRAGNQTVANCASCHGVHDILPSSNPKSSINPKNLPKTCGKCHPGAGSRFVIGRVHWIAGESAPVAVQWVHLAYAILIPFVIGLMFIHHFGDWARKILQSTLRPGRSISLSARKAGATLAEKKDPSSFRMYQAERILHGLLILSFAVLVWTGFALKYSGQWWASPLISWEQAWGWPVRGTIHRVAAVILMAVSLSHVLALIVNKKLRRHWHAMLPHYTDVADGIQNLAFNIGLRERRPPIRSHSYVEKVEYWAVIWGTAVMAITGILLWANTFVLTYLPLVVLEVSTSIHFYEAVLASLAILIWHFYWVIFDPEVYPMDPAWITGYSVRRRDSQRPAEPEKK